jgi:hypothetical protein
MNCLRVTSKIREKYESLSGPNACYIPFSHRAWLNLHDFAKSQQIDIRKRSLHVSLCIARVTTKLIALQILDLIKQLHRQGKRIADMQRLHAILAQQDAGHIKRLTHIMQVSMRQHGSTCKLSQRIMKAIDGTYRPSGQWSGWELRATVGAAWGLSATLHQERLGNFSSALRALMLFAFQVLSQSRQKRPKALKARKRRLVLHAKNGIYLL